MLARRLAVLAVAAGVLTGATAEAKWSKTVPVPAGVRVEIELRSGGIRVTAGADKEVKVSTSEDEGPPVQLDGSRLRIGAGSFDEDITVVVPPSAEIRASTLSGDISVKGTQGAVRINNVSGDVKIHSCRGPVRVNAVSGDVRVHTVQSGLSVSVVNGSLEGENLQGGSVRARLVSGSVKLLGVRARRVDLKTHSGSLQFRGVLEKGGTLNAKAFSGSLNIELPKDAAFEIEGRTRSGSIEVGYPLKGEKGENSVRGTVNGGGAEINVKTFSGNVRIAPAP